METTNVTGVTPGDGNNTSVDGSSSPFEDVVAILTAVVLGILILTTILGKWPTFMASHVHDIVLFVFVALIVLDVCPARPYSLAHVEFESRNGLTRRTSPGLGVISHIRAIACGFTYLFMLNFIAAI